MGGQDQSPVSRWWTRGQRVGESDGANKFGAGTAPWEGGHVQP